MFKKSKEEMQKLWNSVLINVEKKLNNPRAFEIWIKPVLLREIEDKTLKLELPAVTFEKGFIPFLGMIKEEFYILEQWYPEVELVYREEQSTPKKVESELKLNPAYTFEQFIVGQSNRFAHSAALAVAQSPGIAYNPLFLHGGFGLGKTHLMQAIGQFAISVSQTNVLYIPAEIYVNEFIQNIKNRTMQSFKNKFRNLEFLLIDDIHFIAGKEGSQEEFFHTFNYLYDQRKQIILSSDRPPKEIAFLEKRLLSRFEWGLVADIQPPDFETRVAILKKKCENKNIHFKDEIIFYIADNIKDNVRILEGVLNRIFAYSSLLNKEINIETLDEIIKGSYKERSKIVNIDLILEKVCEYFRISEEEIKSKRRVKNILVPRQIAMFLSKELTNNSLNSIAAKFGAKDHTTVMHSCKKIRILYNSDDYTKRVVEDIKSSLLDT
ncbi:chromosomal replication initiator protein DnaA [bacterium]|jgi:chromosomal replication initiator protein|nr:chromosomal replication initiator protein DnaA [bacterium]